MRPILPNMALADRWKDFLALVSEYLKTLNGIKMPRYFTSLTHGIAILLEVRMASHEKNHFLGQWASSTIFKTLIAVSI